MAQGSKLKGVQKKVSRTQEKKRKQAKVGGEQSRAALAREGFGKLRQTTAGAFWELTLFGFCFFAFFFGAAPTKKPKRNGLAAASNASKV